MEETYFYIFQRQNNHKKYSGFCKSEGIQEMLVAKHRYSYNTSTSEQRDCTLIEMLGS